MYAYIGAYIYYYVYDDVYRCMHAVGKYTDKHGYKMLLR